LGAVSDPQLDPASGHSMVHAIGTVALLSNRESEPKRLSLQSLQLRQNRLFDQIRQESVHELVARSRLADQPSLRRISAAILLLGAPHSI
jgi:hypothetical protein